ncbi:hypothetical protein D3C71_1281980 [compost metagenome]
MMAAMPLGSASCDSSGAYGAFSTISTPSGPLALRLSISLPTALPRGDWSIQRCRLATTSSAVSSRPLCSATPLRSVMA